MNSKAKIAVYHALRAERHEFSFLKPANSAAKKGDVLPAGLLKFLESPVKNVVDTQLNNFREQISKLPDKNIPSIDLATGKIDTSTPEKASKIILPKNLTKNTKKIGDDVSSEEKVTRSKSKSKSKKDDENGLVFGFS